MGGPFACHYALRAIEDVARDEFDATWVAQATQQGVKRGLFTRRDVARAVSRGERKAAS